MSLSFEQRCISLLTTCRTLKTLQQIHAILTTTDLLASPYIAGKLILVSAITLPNTLPYAHRLLLQIPTPDIFMYNTLIRGLSESPSPHHSLLTYIDMRRKTSLQPDSFSFAFLLKASASNQSLSQGMQVHCQSVVHGMDAHLFVATTGVSMYAECGCIGDARRVFDEMPQPNIVAWNAIVTACFKCGDVDGAEEFFKCMPCKSLTSWNVMLSGYMKAGKTEAAKSTFKEMPVKDSVSWSTMIVGFAQNGGFDDAFECFKEMYHGGGRASEVSLTGVLSACAQAGEFAFGKVLHGLIEKAGFGLTVSVGNALLDTYSRCGNVEMARLVFDWMMERKDIISWSSMIAAYAMHGLGEEAVELFREMEASETAPDWITCVTLLYACSHAGLFEEGIGFFHRMQAVYGIEPSVEHYGCMVDLYGRAGQLSEAYDFVIKMPIEPNDIIWRTLLGACSIHGDFKLAEKVKERLSALDPTNSGDHVLLSNIYAVAGKWKDVVSVRSTMTERNIKKDPGWSMVEVDKRMYNFVVGESLYAVTQEAHDKLVEIMSRIRIEGGYIPKVGSVFRDIEEEEKESAVSMHSEKLAVAFGISKLDPGNVIRIVKNLRICLDCHVVMKLISKVYQTRIVLRDRNRFHAFQEGECSCKDFW